MTFLFLISHGYKNHHKKRLRQTIKWSHYDIFKEREKLWSLFEWEHLLFGRWPKIKSWPLTTFSNKTRDIWGICAEVELHVYIHSKIIIALIHHIKFFWTRTSSEQTHVTQTQHHITYPVWRTDLQQLYNYSISLFNPNTTGVWYYEVILPTDKKHDYKHQQVHSVAVLVSRMQKEQQKLCQVVRIWSSYGTDPSRSRSERLSALSAWGVCITSQETRD